MGQEKKNISISDTGKVGVSGSIKIEDMDFSKISFINDKQRPS